MVSGLPLVSIGMPVFNMGKTIIRSLDSLLNQTYPNVEIIVSDNCSTDQTVEVCKKYAEKYSKIKLNFNKENLGIVANFKIVHSKGRGKYFMWAAADDYWKPEFINTLVNELEADPAASIAQCAIQREYTDGRLKDIIRFNGQNNPNRLSHWQLASRLLSPKDKMKYLKYNQFIYGIFKYNVISDILGIEDNILMYGDRFFVALVAMAHRFRYVDQVLFYRTVTESFGLRYPNDSYKKTKGELSKTKYYSKIYYKFGQCIISYPNIPFIRKLYVFSFFYYLTQRFLRTHKKKNVHRLKKKIRRLKRKTHKILYGKKQ